MLKCGNNSQKSNLFVNEILGSCLLEFLSCGSFPYHRRPLELNWHPSLSFTEKNLYEEWGCFCWLCFLGNIKNWKTKQSVFVFGHYYFGYTVNFISIDLGIYNNAKENEILECSISKWRLGKHKLMMLFLKFETIFSWFFWRPK